MTSLLDILRKSKTYNSIKSELSNNHCQLQVRGVKNSSLAYFISCLRQDFTDYTFLVVTQIDEEIENLAHDISMFLNDDSVLSFPPWQTFLHEGASTAREILANRMLSLERLIHGQRNVIVTSIKALVHKIIPIKIFKEATLHFAIGKEIDLTKVPDFLTHSGYQRVNLVEMKGDFAIRGGIIDIYPLSYDQPIRIELFGDEIESIRQFDPISQRTTKAIDKEIWVVPMSEIVFTPEVMERWRNETEKIIKEFKSLKLSNEISMLTAKLIERGTFDGIEACLPLLYSDLSNLWDYLPEKAIIVAENPGWMRMEVKKLVEQAQSYYENEIAMDHVVAHPSAMFSSFDEFMSISRQRKTIFISHGKQEDDTDANKYYDLRIQHFDGLRGNFHAFLREIENWQNKGYFVNIMSDNEKQAERLREMMLDRNINNVSIHICSITSGFASDELKLALVSDNEMFGRYRRIHRKKRFKEGIPISSFIDLNVGDYVVHVSYGIGKYGGIKQLKIEGRPQDFLMINYLDGDILYVPTYQLNMVQKYIGGDNANVKMDKLGGVSWERTKSRIKASVRKIAKELLELYAAREAGRGHAFSPDTPWQYEFESAFPYEETEDQLQAIEDVKADMEKPKPMDRLVCGDVGYGKTEVALRAAFKAVMDNKQVAVLVPTTVLAQQHFNTFTKRFADYPVRIEMLSRFLSQKDQKKVVTDLSLGIVDIVIGTHRLLSNDVKFKDLGLLIIDEEQRFGVVHKEKLKQMRKMVDVLTLTATPIPRTLHMSIMGARDLSVINTPPENRLPIETFVTEYNPKLIRDAILREMDRGGQVFFVHNRVDSIESIAFGLSKLVPEARIAVAHGQMSERQLENVMMDFINYEYDVLVCTTIIESGLDIPNVNTIIINRADALGLAQLYQLRGRVGRDRYKAYGYLFYPEGRSITEESQKRLRVIEEFTDLGSGFQIALRDMEIRGIGNILGAEQHGHISAVGYDMYCKLLEEAVKELKGEKIEEEFEPRLNLAVSAYIPDDYIPDSNQKISMYKKIAQINGNYDDIIDELEDRYGRIPVLVRRLLSIAEIKNMAKSLGIKDIISGNEEIKISFDINRTTVKPQKLIELIKNNNKITLSPPAHLMVNIDKAGQDQQLQIIKNILQQLS